MAVAVFGSINMDLVVRAPQLPTAGQTLTGHSFFSAAGGKGANQAVACAQLDIQTRLIGCVGTDTFGAVLRQGLNNYRVDISGVTEFDGPSGVALITVDDYAENTIVIVAGANGTLKADSVVLEGAFRDARVLLLQLEVPIAESLAAARLARTNGLTVILDPAPAQPLPPEFYRLVDILTPNESEALQLVGHTVNNEQSAAAAAKTLLERGTPNVIIKMGSKGVYWAHGAVGRLFPAYPVQAVDTVAAGDAFNGGLAAALSEGHAFEDAIQWGLATAAISVTRIGAQPSMPSRAEVMALLAGS